MMRICIIRSLQGKAARICLGCHVGIADVPKLPTKTTNTAAYLEGEGLQSANNILGMGNFWGTDAAVPAKHSTLLAFVMTASTTENNTVDATMKLSLAIGEWMK